MEASRFRTNLFLISSQIIPKIIEADEATPMGAIHNFYNSKTYQLLESENSNYWWYSPEEIFQDFWKEAKNGKKI